MHTLTIDGNQLQLEQNEANTIKGFGLLSCNNTSRLLMDYKWEHPQVYQQVLQHLFGGQHPLMRMLKVELGSDSNTSCGTEPAPQRAADEPANVARGMGFQLIADAKKIQPDLKTCMLRWAEPGFLRPSWRQVKSDDPDEKVPTEAFEAMYQYYKQTVIAAWQAYGYLFDYIDPDRNETKHPMYRYLKWFANRLKTDQADFPEGFPVADYHAIKLITSDQNYGTDMGTALLNDPELQALIPAVGYHYNTDDGPDKPFTKIADQLHKEVWYSEGIAPVTFGALRTQDTTGIGIGGPMSALDVANRLVKSYARSRRSLYIFQPAIGGLYPGAKYPGKQLLEMDTPWSGYFQQDTVALAVMHHFTDFAVTGWRDQTAAKNWRYVPSATVSEVAGTENLTQAFGAASAMTLVAPDEADYTVVLINDTSAPQTYQIAVKNLAAATKPLHVWQTWADKAGKIHDREKTTTLTPVNGNVTVTIEPRAIISATTADFQPQALLPNPDVKTDQPLQQDPENHVLFHDDYTYADMPADYLTRRGGTPKYTTDMDGAFEVVEQDGKRGLQQKITEQSRALAWETQTDPNFTVGDIRWLNYAAALKFTFDTTTRQNTVSANYIGLGVRSVDDFEGSLFSAPYVATLTVGGKLRFYVRGALAATLDVPVFDAEVSHELIVEATDRHVTVQVDGQTYVTYDDPSDQPGLAGQVKVGTGYFKTVIQSLTVTSTSAPAVLGHRRDDLDASLTFSDDQWERLAARFPHAWERSQSIGEKGATVDFDVEGTGFVLFGTQAQPSRLQLAVDGRMQEVVPLTALAKQPNTVVTDLAAGRHHVKVTVIDGSYTFDGVASIL
ncbi:galactosidase [Lacticaseibacillus rhamnosus K32]|uniref:galactosidase n=1 Tax=Lacticaseibacillus rhamnosus TaxID=47715 RepID=UPI0004E3C274|nr:galactosidase [Lacticaseibacillus rhamnosus]KFC35354.1 galactosidase [Lacticaseibacillus rhamnosus K32]OAU25585.1 galactosidase [Lacticaseibacillus rhamnosus]WHM89849.1 galactosidase [Lacticaseibacillus rhamnosus]